MRNTCTMSLQSSKLQVPAQHGMSKLVAHCAATVPDSGEGDGSFRVREFRSRLGWAARSQAWRRMRDRESKSGPASQQALCLERQVFREYPPR